MKTLPAEILHYIFQRVNINDRCNCALVCRAWLTSIQNILYTDVVINGENKFEQFEQTVRHDVQLGMKVQSLKLNIHSKNQYVINRRNMGILTTLFSTCLYNLVTLQFVLDVPYTVVKQALMDSQLKNLKRLKVHPFQILEDDYVEYIDCALLMKDRLEELFISYFTDQISNQPVFQQLRNVTGQFSQLKTIVLKIRDTDEGFMFMDNIIDDCSPTLEEVELCVVPNITLRGNRMISLDSIAPKPNVKKFTFDGVYGPIRNDGMLSYLMHKFPQLVQCKLYSTIDMSSSVLEQFSTYVSQLKELYLFNIVMDYKFITKVLSNYWKNASKYGREHIDLRYTGSSLATDKLLKLCKNTSSIVYSVPPASSNEDWKHHQFLKENGKFLKEVNYHFYVEDKYHLPQNTTLPDDVLIESILCCPWIQRLSFEKCTLKPLATDLNSFDVKRSLNQLSFSSCRIHEGALDSLAKVVGEVKHLKVFDIGYVPGEKNGESKANRFMTIPDVKVDLITFILTPGPIYNVKVLNSIDGSTYYLKVNYNQNVPIILTEEEFLGAPDRVRVEICCKSNPSIKTVKSSAYRIFLY